MAVSEKAFELTADAAAAMRAEILARPPQTLTIIALGPLTNVAAVLRDDAVAGRVRRVVYGRRDPAHGGLGSVESVHTSEQTNHPFPASRPAPDWRLVACASRRESERQAVHCAPVHARERSH